MKVKLVLNSLFVVLLTLTPFGKKIIIMITIQKFMKLLVRLILNFYLLFIFFFSVNCDVSELIYQNDGSQQEDNSGENDAPLAVDLLSKGNFDSANDNDAPFTILTNNNLGDNNNDIPAFPVLKADEPRINILTERPYVAPNTNNDEAFNGYNYEKPAVKFEFGSSEQKDKIEEFNGYDYPKPLKQLAYPSNPSSVDLPEDAVRTLDDSSESDSINPTYNN